MTLWISEWFLADENYKWRLVFLGIFAGYLIFNEIADLAAKRKSDVTLLIVLILSVCILGLEQWVCAPAELREQKLRKAGYTLKMSGDEWRPHLVKP